MRRLNEGNKVEFDSRDEAIDEGYRSCRNAGRKEHKGGEITMKLLRVLFFVTLFIFAATNQSGATAWTWTDSTPTADYFVDLKSTYYETDSNNKPLTNIIYYIQSIDHTPEAGPELSKIFGSKFRNTRLSIWKKSIHLVDKTISTHSVFFFNAKGRLIDVFDFSPPICSIVSPHSLDDSEFRIIGKYVRAHRDEVLLRTIEFVEKKKQNRSKEALDRE